MLTSRRGYDETGAREMHVHVAHLRVGASDHDLLRVRAHELARNRILADVVGRHPDLLARLAAGGIRNIRRRWRRGGSRGFGDLERALRTGLAPPTVTERRQSLAPGHRAEKP